MVSNPDNDDEAKNYRLLVLVFFPKTPSYNIKTTTFLESHAIDAIALSNTNTLKAARAIGKFKLSRLVACNLSDYDLDRNKCLRRARC